MNRPPTHLVFRVLPGLVALSGLLISSGALAEPGTATVERGAAETAPPAVAEQPPRPLVPSQFRLQSTKSHAGVGALFSQHAVELFSCRGPCGRGRVQLSLPLPEEVRGLRRSETVISLAGGQKLLWIRYGDKDYFSFLILGAPIDQPSSPPRLLLKGWTKDDAGLIVDPTAPLGEEVQVRGPEEPALCGRSLPQWAKRFDAEKDRFVPVRVSPLSPTEKRQAVELSAEPVILQKDDGLLRLYSRGERSAAEPTDGDRSQAWQQGYDFVSLGSFDEGSAEAFSLDELIIQLASEPKGGQDREPLWVVTDDRVFAVRFAPGHVLQQLVLPAGSTGKCLAVIQPQDAHPIVELMGRARFSGNSLNDLVEQLNSSTPGASGAALLLRGAAAAQALSSVYNRLTDEGKRRVEGIAPHFVGKPGAYLEATIAAHGSADAAQAAIESLASRGPSGIDAARSYLTELTADSGELLGSFLVERDPLAALSAALGLMNRPDAAGRQWGRDLILRVASTPVGGKQIDETLSAVASKELELSRRVLVELARVFGDRKLLAKTLSELCASASFEEAYLLTPVLVAKSGDLEGARGCLQAWLSGKGVGDPEPPRKAALSVHLAETLIDTETPITDSGWTPGIDQSIASDNVRQRIAGLRLLEWRAKTSASEGKAIDALPHQAVVHQLRKDPWPRVRSAAAVALGTMAPLLEESKRSEVDKILSTRMKKDHSDEVRRSIARAASRSRGQRVRIALRRALSSDPSYLVRSEAALSLGRLCDTASLSILTRRAQSLATPALDEDQVQVGLSALSALIQLNPPDIEQRIAPLLGDDVPKMLKARVEARLMMMSEGTFACSASGDSAMVLPLNETTAAPAASIQ